MPLSLQTSITTARTILNDPSGVRYTDSELLGYANDALDALAKLVPQLFYQRTTFTCAAGAFQQLLAANSIGLVGVHRVSGGNAVTMADVEVLDRFSPGWRAMASAAAIHWMKDSDDPRGFLVYPPAAANQQLEITHVAVPMEYTAAADTGLPAPYADPIADYIVYRAESRDDEHVLSQRAAQFMASFVQKVKG